MNKFTPGGHVVFVCAGNQTRSPTAAEVFKAKMKARGINCFVESAGYLQGVEGLPANHQWANVMGAEQYDLSEHRSRYLGSVKFSSATLFVCMDRDVMDEVSRIPGIKVENVIILNPPHGVGDPHFSLSSRVYQDTFTLIYGGVNRLIDFLLRET